MNNPLSEVNNDEALEFANRIGFTFENFCKDPAKWRVKPNDTAFAIADKGSTLLRRSITKQVYAYKCWESKKLEHIEKILADHGLRPQDVVMKPELIYLGAGKMKCIIEFVEKENATSTTTQDSGDNV